MDLSWFLILIDGGLRISELLTLYIRHGKGGHERRVPVTARTTQALSAHLASRSPEPQTLLLIRQGRPLSDDYVRQRLHAFAAQARVDDVTPHRLRHTYATRLINNGQLPITSLQKLMGHERIDTTMQYVAIYDQTIPERL